MKTPQGRECPFYYRDVQRWHTGEEECRLLQGEDAERWESALCATCPVPDIKRANACSQMSLEGRIRRPGLRFWQGARVVVTASCSRVRDTVANPYVGCGHCHEEITFVVVEEA
ncbi:MAG: hypothetical protein ACLFU8_01120 [Anaerolineales bacterium]